MRGNTGPVYQLWISPNTFDGEFLTIHFSHKHKGLLKLKRKENSSWIITFILFLWTRNFLLIIIIINFYRGSTNFTKKIMPFFFRHTNFSVIFSFFPQKMTYGESFFKKIPIYTGCGLLIHAFLHFSITGFKYTAALRQILFSFIFYSAS